MARMGSAHAISNLGKFIEPGDRAVIARLLYCLKPVATLAAIVPPLDYFAFMWALRAAGRRVIGMEGYGRGCRKSMPNWRQSWHQATFQSDHEWHCKRSMR